MPAIFRARASPLRRVARRKTLVSDQIRAGDDLICDVSYKQRHVACLFHDGNCFLRDGETFLRRAANFLRHRSCFRPDETLGRSTETTFLVTEKPFSVENQASNVTAIVVSGLWFDRKKES